MATQKPDALHTSRLHSPTSSVADASVDGNSLHRPSLWDSEHSSPAVLQDGPDAHTEELLDPPRNPHDEDPGCRGKNGRTYSFKVKLESAI